MSIRSQKRKLRSNQHERAWRLYWEAYVKWERREPPLWRIFAWLKWRCERPYKPKDAREYEAIYDKYGFYWKEPRWRWYR